MMYRSNVNTSSDILFYKQLSNIKQTLINNNLHNHIVDKQIKLKLALTKFILK